MEFHPLANLFPLLEGAEFTALAEDIRQNGVREPVVLLDGKILDGRNRWRASQSVGVTAPMVEFDGGNPLAFVISLNLCRRHLDETERAMVAAKLTGLKPGDNQHSRGPANLPDLEPVSQAQAAELLNVGDRSVRHAVKVRAEGSPELVEAAEQGRVSVSLAAQIAEMPDEAQSAVVARVNAGEKPVEAFRSVAHVAHNSGENEWYTPAPLVDAARSVMGGIDVDPASCSTANETVKARQFFDMNTDGLAQEWRGRVWMNPPYAQPLIQQFIAKLAHELDAGRVQQACVLVNNGTETAWGQSLLSMADAVCFPRSRIRFVDRNGSPGGAPLQGQMIAYVGPDPEVFAEVFGPVGRVLRG